MKTLAISSRIRFQNTSGNAQTGEYEGYHFPTLPPGGCP